MTAYFLLLLLQSYLYTFLGVIQDYDFCSVTWSEIDGTTYKPRAFIVLHGDILPKFYEIVEVIV